MIPRGLLQVVMERLGHTPNAIQEVLAELDREMADPAEPDSVEPFQTLRVPKGWPGQIPEDGAA